MPEPSDEYWLRRAITCAEQGAADDEVPVGAVIVKAGELVAEAYNQPISCCDPTAHAEIQAIRLAGEKLNNYRLVGCTLYVTMEPCVMCTGAIIHSRIERVVYGACEPKMGAVESAFQLLQAPEHFHVVDVQGGLLVDECRDLIQQFFKRRRREKKALKRANTV